MNRRIPWHLKVDDPRQSQATVKNLTEGSFDIAFYIRR